MLFPDVNMLDLDISMFLDCFLDADVTVRENCSHSEMLWSVFFGIQTAYSPVFSTNAGKYRPENLRMHVPFAQCKYSVLRRSLSLRDKWCFF